jgi:simple sugar transport system substrate-binding protein
MRVFSKALLGAAAIVFGLSAVASAESTRVVFVTHGQSADPYWSVVKNGVDEAAKTLGVAAEYQSPETFDMVAMAKMIDAAVASKPDGLVVSIPDKAALGDSVKNAVAAGIPVIVIDSGGVALTHELGGMVYLGQDEYLAGKAAGERMKAAGIKHAACLNHEVGNTSLDDRCRGVQDGLGSEVPVVQGTMDPTEMKGRTLAYLNANPDTDFLIACGIGAAEPALAALEETGKVGAVRLGTFDMSPAILKAIDAGHVDFAIDAQQYMMGYVPVVMFDLMKRYKLQPVADFPTGPGFVGKAEAASVIELSAKGIR